MAGEYDGSSLIECVLNRGESSGYALGIGDFTSLLVLRDIEINADEDALACEVEVFDCFFSLESGEERNCVVVV